MPSWQPRKGRTQVKHREIAAGRRIEAAVRILSAVSFLSATALMACRSEKTQETPFIAFTKIPPAAPCASVVTV